MQGLHLGPLPAPCPGLLIKCIGRGSIWASDGKSSPYVAMIRQLVILKSP